jgi:single-strand DNA-binding protein
MKVHSAGCGSIGRRHSSVKQSWELYRNFVPLIRNNKTFFFKHLNLQAMSTLRNRVQLIGRVGNDPEVKSFEGGKKLATVSIATSESYKNDKGERVEQTEWHRIVAWGKTAEIIEQFVTKGREIAIDGKLTHRSYDDKDGTKRFVTEVVANDVQLLGSK